MSTRPTLYKGKSGQWAFVLHRITGFGVFFFLLLHIVDVALVNNARRYNEVHALYGNVVLRVLECGLLLGLLYHALNGLRIIAIDFFNEGARHEQAVFWWGVVFPTLAAGLPGCYVILRPFIQGHF